MIECRNCGGAVRFDIPSQKVVCDHCGSIYDPEEMGKERIAHEAGDGWGAEPQHAGGGEGNVHGKGDYEVTVFTCPQCGGEIISYQNEATEFCSYCGASVELAGRMSKEQKPKYIVPFSVSREECIETYQQHLKKLPFVPKEMKSEESQQKFCGIYMPFWLYQVHQKGPLHLDGTRVSGDYKEFCSLDTEIDTVYEKICYDASSGFDDTLAQMVAPFSFDAVKDFNPAYLCGFYTDRADVDASVYKDKAIGEAADRTIETLTGADSSFDGFEFEDEEKNRVPSTIECVESALLPVWFLTWRTRDRVSYSVVNGTKSKVTADIPIDRKMYLIFSAVIGVALAALLYFLFPVITPSQSVKITFLLAIAGLWMYQGNFHERMKQETHEEDQGFSGETAYFQGKRKWKSESIISAIILAGAVVVWAVPEIGSSSLMASIGNLLLGHILTLLFMIALLGEIWLHIRLFADYRLVQDRRMLRDTLPLPVASVCSVLLLMIRPSNDLFYYLATILTGVCLLLILLGMIGQYNDLATRPLPAFHNRKRGDGNV